jgi:signal recognition particle GTPase
MVFGKLLKALKKTREVLTAGLGRLFSIGRKLDESFLEELEEVLYNSDLGPVGTKVTEDLKAAWKRRDGCSPCCRAAKARSRGQPRRRP